MSPGQRTKTIKGANNSTPTVLKPARLGVVPRTGHVASFTEKDGVDDDNDNNDYDYDEEELLDADAAIEPCLVGWSETDAAGVEVYCCEQPGGGMECRTVSSDHSECVIVEGEDGSMHVSCDEDDVVAVKLKAKQAEEVGRE